MKCVKGLGFLWVAVFAAFFALSACDDSSSATEDNNETSAVESSSSTTINKDNSSDSENELSSSSDEEQNTGESKEYSSSSRKTSSKSESSSSVFDSESSSSEGEVFSCTKEGQLAKIDGIPHICENGVYVLYVAPSSSSRSLHFEDSSYLAKSQFGSELIQKMAADKYHEYHDSRNNVTYRTLRIVSHPSITGHDSLEIFLENINIGKQVSLTNNIFNDDEIEKYCYNDDSWYCDNFYGGLYTWSEAMQLPKACDTSSLGENSCSVSIQMSVKSERQGICPEGWFVFNESVWSDIHQHVGATIETHSYANFVANGMLYDGADVAFVMGGTLIGTRYSGMGKEGNYWQPAEVVGSRDSSVYVDMYSTMFVHTEYKAKRTSAMSVRCAKWIDL